MTKWQFYGQVSTADRRREGNESAAAAIDVVDSEDTMTGTASRGQTNGVTLNFPPLRILYLYQMELIARRCERCSLY